MSKMSINQKDFRMRRRMNEYLQQNDALKSNSHRSIRQNNGLDGKMFYDWCCSEKLERFVEQDRKAVRHEEVVKENFFSIWLSQTFFMIFPSLCSTCTLNMSGNKREPFKNI